MFFQGKDEVHQTMRRVASVWNEAGIPYAIVGGMAVNAHKYRRTTDDVDLLLTPEGLGGIREAVRRRRTTQPDPDGRDRFIDRENGVSIDILVTGRFPGQRATRADRLPRPGRRGRDDRRSCSVVNLPHADPAQAGGAALSRTSAMLWT